MYSCFIPCTLGWSQYYGYPAEAYLNRIAVFTLKVVDCWLRNTSKKSKLLRWKRVVDAIVNPFGQLLLTSLCAPLTLLAFIRSHYAKFTAFLAIQRPRSQTRPRSFGNFLGKKIDYASFTDWQIPIVHSPIALYWSRLLLTGTFTDLSQNRVVG